MAEAANTSRPAVRAVVDFGGLAAFVIVYFVGWRILHKPSQDALLMATWGVVVGSGLALAVGLLVERRLAPLPLVSGLVALVFGGLTLVLHDTLFLKIKPTVINLLFAGVMLGGVAIGKNPLKLLLSGALKMSPMGWRTLSIRYGFFFLAMAVLNVIVWLSLPEPIWVLFRSFGLPLLSLVFSGTQVPTIMKDMKAMEEAAELEA